VGKSSTIVGVICKDGIVLGAEKLLTSRLMLSTTDKRIYNIDSHIGMVSKFTHCLFPKVLGGKIPDARIVMDRARGET